jgi:HEAT repeat protein
VADLPVAQPDTTELIRWLSHESYRQRVTARQRLVEQGMSALPGLHHALTDRTVSSTGRIHALWALCLLAERDDKLDPSPFVISALHNGPPELRAQAARAIGWRKQRDERTIKGLIHRARNDSDASVRLHAAAALGRIKATEAAAELFASLDEVDDQARDAKIHALRQINTWDIAIAYLNAAEPRVRQGTVMALAGARDVKAAELLRWAAEHSPYKDVRDAAARSLQGASRRCADAPWGVMSCAARCVCAKP